MRSYRIWTTGEAEELEVTGATARDSYIAAKLAEGYEIVRWQEIDADGRELYPEARMVKSRELLAREAKERREYRKVVRAHPAPTPIEQAIKEAPTMECPACKGKGQFIDWVPAPFGSGNVTVTSTCDECDGTGRVPLTIANGESVRGTTTVVLNQNAGVDTVGPTTWTKEGDEPEPEDNESVLAYLVRVRGTDYARQKLARAKQRLQDIGLWPLD